MAKNYSAEQLALRAFVITIGGLILYVGAVFVFVLLR
jgi:hypothetical protein